MAENNWVCGMTVRPTKVVSCLRIDGPLPLVIGGALSMIQLVIVSRCEKWADTVVFLCRSQTSELDNEQWDFPALEGRVAQHCHAPRCRVAHRRACAILSGQRRITLRSLRIVSILVLFWADSLSKRVRPVQSPNSSWYCSTKPKFKKYGSLSTLATSTLKSASYIVTFATKTSLFGDVLVDGSGILALGNTAGSP